MQFTYENITSISFDLIHILVFLSNYFLSEVNLEFNSHQIFKYYQFINSAFTYVIGKNWLNLP